MRNILAGILAIWTASAALPVVAQPLAQRCPDQSQLEDCVQRVIHESERALAAAVAEQASLARRESKPFDGGVQRQWISVTHDSCARLASTSPADLFDVTFAECVIDAFDARLSELKRPR